MQDLPEWPRRQAEIIENELDRSVNDRVAYWARLAEELPELFEVLRRDVADAIEFDTA